MISKTPILLIISFIFILVQCKNKEEISKNTQQPLTSVDIIIAKSENLSREIEANGNVIAKEFAELHPEVSGRLTYLNVPEGNYVSQGTVIAKINNADLQAQLDKIRSQQDLAIKTQERLAKLLSISGVNQADYDAAESQVNSLKADLSYNRALIEKTIVRAPFSGVIGLRQVSSGAYVSPATIIATIQQINELKIDFTIPEEYGFAIKKGTTVEVAGDDESGRRKKAVVVAIEPQVSATTRNLKVRALLKEGKENPGSFVKVYLKSATYKNSIIVPSNAIIPEDKNKTLIVIKGGKAKFTNVNTGNRYADGVEVTSGIANGDSIVVTGVLFVRPEAALKVKNVREIKEIIR